MNWFIEQWHRATWAFNHDGAAWVQGFSAIVTVLVTGILAFITYKYVRLTATLVQHAHQQTEQARQQLLLMAHPNVTLNVDVNVKERRICVSIKNHGAYPFQVSNGILTYPEFAEDGNKVNDQVLFRLNQLEGAIVSSHESAEEYFFPKEITDDIQCGMFSDIAEIQFTCKDVLGLVEKRYSHRNVGGLREID